MWPVTDALPREQSVTVSGPRKASLNGSHITQGVRRLIGDDTTMCPRQHFGETCKRTIRISGLIEPYERRLPQRKILWILICWASRPALLRN
jgi:hypothetical protein